jgi:TonB family protein
LFHDPIKLTVFTETKSSPFVRIALIIFLNRYCPLTLGKFGRRMLSPLILAIVMSVFVHGLVFWVIEKGIFSATRPEVANMLLIQALIVKRSPLPMIESNPVENLSSQAPATNAGSLGPELVKRVEKSQVSDAIQTSQLEKSKAVTPSNPIVGIEPVYPLFLLSSNVRGTVTALFRVGEGGKFEKVEILESIPAGKFDRSVIEAITSARIVEGSLPLNKEMMITVVFDPTGMRVPPLLSVRQ